MNADTILKARQLALAALDTRILRGKLWGLSEEHFVQVVSWLEERLGYEAAEQLCVKELKLPPAKAPDKNSLWRFWEHSGFRPILNQEQRRWCAAGANTAGAEARTNPADWKFAIADKIQQRTYELLEMGVPPGEVKHFVTASLKLAQMDIDREKLAQADRKIALMEAERAKAKAALNDANLSAEEKEQRMKEVFGIA